MLVWEASFSREAWAGIVKFVSFCTTMQVTNFLLQNWGWACEQLVAIDVVTAEGKAILCNKDLHSDLFWAARGAGPGRALKLHPAYLRIVLI